MTESSESVATVAEPDKFLPPVQPPVGVAQRAFMDPNALDDQSAFWVRFLDVLHENDAIRANHRRTVELLGLREGFHLLEVGCGTGRYACDVAELVDPDGQVVGIDFSAALLAVARRRAEERGAQVEFHEGNAQALPFANASFDGCRVERVLQYLAAPEGALAEMVRVTKPGGRVVATEVDWDGIICDLPNIERELWRRAILAVSDGAGNGWMGRELRRHFLDVGLEEVTCEGVTVIVTEVTTVLDDFAVRMSLAGVRDAGTITGEEFQRIVDGIEDAGRAGRCFVAFPMVTVSGRKPLGTMA